MAYSLVNDDRWLGVITGLHFTTSSFLLFSACVALLFVNWLLESKKWQLLTFPLQPLSILQAISSVLAGVAVGTVTPNRIGELGGRTILFTSNNRSSAAILAAMSSIIQLLVTIVCGLVGTITLFLINKQSIFTEIFIISIALFVIMLFVLWLAFQKSNYLSSIIAKIAVRFKLTIQCNITTIGSKKLIQAFALSFARYAVFMLQFLLLLQILGFNNQLLIACCSLSIAYIISAAIPSGVATDLGIKGASVLWVMQQSSINGSIVVTAVFLLWILNVALPSVVGSLILLQHRKIRNYLSTQKLK